MSRVSLKKSATSASPTPRAVSSTLPFSPRQCSAARASCTRCSWSMDAMNVDIGVAGNVAGLSAQSGHVRARP
eukprot:scaffold28649_cov111-Isochrysis_galbana.AAC.6